MVHIAVVFVVGVAVAVAVVVAVSVVVVVGVVFGVVSVYEVAMMRPGCMTSQAKSEWCWWSVSQ